MNITDAGSNCELYGRVVSFVKGPLANETTGHKHWERASSNPLTMSIKGTYTFTDASPHTKEYQDLKHNDEIAVYIRLAEKDYLSNDDKYDNLTFFVPVSRIMTSLNEHGYYNAPAFRVRDQARRKEYIDVFFRFTLRGD